MTCAGHTACEGGVCTGNVDPALLYLVSITGVEVQPTTSSGQPWDSDGSGPDLVVCAVSEPSAGAVCTTTNCANSTSCDLSSSGVLLVVSGSTLRNGQWPVEVRDLDPLGYDVVGTAAVRVTQYYTAGYNVSFGRVVNLSFKLQ
jgi:hypothetical protein